MVNWNCNQASPRYDEEMVIIYNILMCNRLCIMQSQIYDVSSSSFKIQGCVTKNISTLTNFQFIISISNVQLAYNLLNESISGILRKPSPVAKDAAEKFKPKLHSIVPELKDLTEEDLEKLIGERNRDEIDYE